MKSILIIGTEPWFGPLLSKHHITLELCQQNRVLYLEPVYHMGGLFRLQFPKNTYKQVYHQHRPMSLSLLKPWWLPKTKQSRRLRTIAEKFLVKQILARWGKPDLIISFHPNCAFLMKYWDCPFVYYCVDTHFDRNGEIDTITRANLVVTATQKLYKEFVQYATCLKYLPHGVDITTLEASANSLPPDLSSIKRPIAGYVGSINSHLDIELIEETAQAQPTISFVLIGPYAQTDFGGGVSNEVLARLSLLSNLYLLGPKPSTDLGAYISHFDIALIPYDLNHVRVHFSLHKVLQYLALGKPVVTTVNSQDQKLPPSVWLGETTKAFIQGIKSALTEHDEDAANIGRSFALQQSWEQRVKQLSEWILEIS